MMWRNTKARNFRLIEDVLSGDSIPTVAKRYGISATQSTTICHRFLRYVEYHGYAGDLQNIATVKAMRRHKDVFLAALMEIK